MDKKLYKATESWVLGALDSVPTKMVARLVQDSPEEWEAYGTEDREMPMWYRMWSFGNSSDWRWMDNGGLDEMLRLGFVVFRHKDFGAFFGVNAAGVDFYKTFWIPLYKARGLQWHVG